MYIYIHFWHFHNVGNTVGPRPFEQALGHKINIKLYNIVFINLFNFNACASDDDILSIFLKLPSLSLSLSLSVGMVGYGMAKAAVHQLCESLAGQNSGLPAGTVAVAILP